MGAFTATATDAVRRLKTDDETMSWKAFSRGIAGKKTSGEKFSYAYAVMAYMLSKNASGVKRSDTPRQIEKKLADRDDIGPVSEMTDSYEKISYAGLAQPEEKTGRLTAHISGFLKKMMGE